jgi:hypothetical protein
MFFNHYIESHFFSLKLMNCGGLKRSSGLLQESKVCLVQNRDSKSPRRIRWQIDVILSWRVKRNGSLRHYEVLL